MFYREQSPKLCCRRVSRGVSPSLSISPHLSPQHTHWPSRQLSVSSHKSGENAGFQRGSLVAINLCVSAVNGEFQELYNKIVLAFLMYKAIVICVSHSTIYGPSGWGGEFLILTAAKLWDFSLLRFPYASCLFFLLLLTSLVSA